MKKLLITGIAGMLGSHLLDKLVELEYDIVGIDNLVVGKLANTQYIEAELHLSPTGRPRLPQPERSVGAP